MLNLARNGHFAVISQGRNLRFENYAGAVLNTHRQTPLIFPFRKSQCQSELIGTEPSTSLAISSDMPRFTTR